MPVDEMVTGVPPKVVNPVQEVLPEHVTEVVAMVLRVPAPPEV